VILHKGGGGEATTTAAAATTTTTSSLSTTTTTSFLDTRNYVLVSKKENACLFFVFIPIIFTIMMILTCPIQSEVEDGGHRDRRVYY